MSNTRCAAVQGPERRASLSTRPHGCSSACVAQDWGRMEQGRNAMKSVSISDSSCTEQIWNSAPQLANIPVIGTQSLLPPGARAVVIAPHPGDEVLTCGGLLQLLSAWCEEGNSAHGAVGRASANAATIAGAVFTEIPVWAWHWPSRDSALIPWHRARKVRLDTWTVARKSHATHAYASQLDGEPAVGIAPRLPRILLERMRLPYEIVFV